MDSIHGSHSPRASSSSTTSAAQQVFSSLLVPSPLTSSSSPAEVREHFDSRLKDKRLQLSNPDRSRPKPESGSNAQIKLGRREKKARKQLGSMGPPREKIAADGSGKGKARMTENPVVRESDRLLSKRKRKHRGIEGMDEEMSYEALLPLADLWNSYIQQFLGLVRLQTPRAGPNDPNPSSSDLPPQLVPNLQVIRPSPASASSSRGIPVSSSWRLASESALSNVQSQVCKADLLGAHLEVVRAGNPSLVGTHGLVARETEGCFLLALDPPSMPTTTARQAEGEEEGKQGVRRSRRRFFKVVPKHNVTFSLRVPLPPLPFTPQAPELRGGTAGCVLEIPLQGNQMSSTMVTRASKKWKQRKTMDY
ncbi:hypothetical protein BCV69DRAFT_311643 [Microstroma glucosiphilum]|uniref:Uncharacterized protein n=1 Tax=Pseudomicrostroma glucosiphilum TaxID=1684307 RepID=A0A316UFN0_9BASI|nr:hypothetical protein BCV69DRAFT_311643 [Pseudomicrostroma glucosiphilum]PWN21945.1 hypothetical protein BCV69DRAFT_311643 [Pseudomicrostroma glucosiphilum]